MFPILKNSRKIGLKGISTVFMVRRLLLLGQAISISLLLHFLCCMVNSYWLTIQTIHHKPPNRLYTERAHALLSWCDPTLRQKQFISLRCFLTAPIPDSLKLLSQAIWSSYCFWLPTLTKDRATALNLEIFVFVTILQNLCVLFQSTSVWCVQLFLIYSNFAWFANYDWHCWKICAPCCHVTAIILSQQFAL